MQNTKSDSSIENRLTSVLRPGRKFAIGLASAGLIVAAVGCGVSTEPQTGNTAPPAAALVEPDEAADDGAPDTPSVETEPAEPAEVSDVVALPDSLEYSVTETDWIDGIKRSIDVQLSEGLTVEQLELLGNTLRDAEPAEFERTFIGYYLPGMEVDAGYWATTHFNPELEVRVLGMPVEE